MVRIVVDNCGRPQYRKKFSGKVLPAEEEGKYSLNDADHILDSFIKQCGINLDIEIIRGSRDTHHVLEAIFKALGLALNVACTVEPRRKSISSTKGIIDL